MSAPARQFDGPSKPTSPHKDALPLWEAEDEATACAAMLEDRAEALAGTCLRISLGYFVCAACLLPLILRTPLLAHLSIAGHVAAAIGLVFNYLVIFRRRRLRLNYALLQTLFMAGLSGYVHLALAMATSSSDALLYSTSYILLTIGFVMTFPYVGRALVSVTLAYCLLSLFAYWPSPDFGVLVWLESASAGLALVFTWFFRRREAHLATAEYRNIRYAAEAASVRFAHELELARQIQDSLTPPRSLTLPDGDHLNVYQLRHAKVGGDWVAMRRMDNNDLILVVADATGKGMQAALVIYAVQSLWADCLNDRTFHPVSWFARLNRMLLTLGERSPHSLTLGLAVIKRTNLIYWSAGHWPLYVISGTQRDVVDTVPARGSMLGISKEVEFKPRGFTFAPDSEATILLATDGLFDALPRHKPRALVQLLPKLDARGEAAFADYPVNDDLTVACLRRHGRRA